MPSVGSALLGELKTVAVALLVALVVVLGHAHFNPPPPTMVKVGLKGLVEGFVLDTAKSVKDEHEVAARTEAFIQGLNSEVNRIAETYNVIIVPKEAVMAGAPDVTGLVEQALREGSYAPRR